VSLEPSVRRLVYGRRRGRPLRRGQQELFDELLPRLNVEVPAAGELDPQILFADSPRPIWLEIGFGGGEHLAELAERHPEIGFIGCEVFENGIGKLLAEIARRGLDNVRLFAEDARVLLDILMPGSIDRVFILFPDPWPKQRHHKRRIVSEQTLDRLAVVMRDGAELRLATDDCDYLVEMLACLTGHPAFDWLACRAEDWRSRPADWPPTRYEGKAIAAGRAPVFLRFRRRIRTDPRNRQNRPL
jgi:tRNA (guanine-N7-)-methyltransferase